MRRFVLALTLVLAAATHAPAGDAEPVTLLAAVHAKHADLMAKGLSSYSAHITLRRADDDNVAAIKDQASFTYTFTGPDQEEFDFKDTVDAVRKPFREVFGGQWREVTGALWFAAFETAENLAIEPGNSPMVVSGTSKVAGAFKASIDKAALRLDQAVIAEKFTFAWTSVESDQGWRVRRRDVMVGDKLAYITTFDGLRDVGGYALPTVVKFKADGKWTEFAVEYTEINGKSAAASPFDPAIVKAKVEEFEKGWRTFSDDQKVDRLRELSELDHDLASAAIAKLALKDSSASVREQAAEALGWMKRTNVVPALLASLAANEKEIRVYLRIVEALGEIGDPRAVDALSKDWWNQRVPEYGVVAAKAKIHALGKIRHVSAVDALLDTFTLASDDKINQFRPDIVASLTKLTGQNFNYDRKAWGDWWKKARPGYRF